MKFIYLMIWTLVWNYANPQNLTKVALSKKSKTSGVINSYRYDGKGHYQIIKLELYHDGSFFYSLSSFQREVFSKGNWALQKDTLILISIIKENELPVKLVYSTDTTKNINEFRIAVVKNLNGEEMPDGLVVINHDSIKCAPSYALCDYQYKSIDSIRIVFENGLSSRWINVQKKRDEMILPIVQTDFLISSYVSFNKKRYIKLKTGLKPVK